MKKILSIVFVFSLICASLTGCIQWETPATYALMNEFSSIESIRIYQSDYPYKYSDPDDPCSEMLAEIPADQFAAFTEELTGLSFKNEHLIILFPVTFDPNFYYGDYIVKITYNDGSCELISNVVQRQFRVDKKYADTTDYIAENEAWLAFLQNWADISNS